MTTVKAILSSFPYTYPSSPPRHSRISNQRKRTRVLVACSSNDTGSSPQNPEGDEKTQDLLAKIAHLQAQKVRLTDYLDERSAYLTQFAEEANTEFDAIAEDTLKGLDQAEERIMQNLRAFEESMGSNKAEIERSERELADFEEQMEKDRNDGLFFKSLGKAAPERQEFQRAKAKEEVQKLKEVTSKSTQMGIRKNIYLLLLGLLTLSVVDYVSSFPKLDWRKASFLGAVLLALLAQFLYEQTMSSEPIKPEEIEEETERED
ncbi:hypothetical protein AMTRI_Chr08g160090 [Amborella trichopoda]